MKRRAIAVVFLHGEVHVIDTTMKRWERDAATIQYMFDHVAHSDEHVSGRDLDHDDLMDAEVMLVEYDPDDPAGEEEVWPNVVSYCREFGVEVDDSVPVIG